MFMELSIEGRTLELVQGDITKEDSDAIVNAANSRLARGGGVDGAIHRAGGPVIMEECRKIGGCPTGKAVITSGGNLKARYVIHTVGPIYRGGGAHEAELLASAYRESLKLAVDNGLKTVSFPSISTGAYGYPIKEAAKLALSTVKDFMEDHPSIKKVRFVLFGSDAYDAYAEALNKLK
jgi:O-acetyl-ADP-ribose deacetylase (regulator of RNase III)